MRNLLLSCPLYRISTRVLLLICLGVGGISTFTLAAASSLVLDWKAPLAQDHPLVGRVYQSQGEMTLESLADLMADSRFVLIGEKHDNADHHQLELYLLKMLVERNTANNTIPSVAVTLEMLDSSQQSQVDLVIERIRQNDGPELELDELKSSLDWPPQGWPWADYSALIGWTLNSGLSLYAGNIGSDMMRDVYKNGIDDQFASAIALKTPVQDALLDQVFDGHCGLLPRESLASMVDIQLVRDSQMARALMVSAGKQNVLIAGAGHTRKDTAVPKHLQVLGESSVLSVALVEVDVEKNDAADYHLFDRFDVAIFTPIATRHDYCADLEKSLQKKTHKQ